jgi:N-acetylmuramoyl-L-alanine amidase
LSKIALQYGLRDYNTIYQHPQNADFRRRRPDPNIIFPGDRIFIPPTREKHHEGRAGQGHRFVVRATTRELKIAMEDFAGKRVAGAAYELVIEGVTYTGTTTGDGLVVQRIRVDAEEGTLQVGTDLWPLKIGHLNPMENAADDGVSGMQARLRNLGYNPGPVDGVLGPRTTAAIRAFQRDNAPLVVDGICGPRTRAKLREKHGC